MSSAEDEYWNLQVKIIICGYYVYCCTLAIGLVGNITTVMVILCSKFFHTLTGSYLLSLSATDLLTLLTAVSFYVFRRQSKVLQYIVEWASQTSTIVSIWTVTTFTMEKYLAICHPFFRQSKKSRVRQIIFGIWLIGALLALVWAPYNIYKVLYTHMVASKFRTVKFDDDFEALVDHFYLANLLKQILYALSTALNPIIFSLMSKKFHDALKALISSGCRNVFNWSLRSAGSRNNSNTVETHA